LPFRACDDHSGTNDAHHKAGLIKVPDIISSDTVLRDYVLYEPKPATDNGWIFAFGSLIVISTKKTRLELSVSLDKVGSPLLADRWRIAVGEQSVGHFFHTT
jgi:hypothetical protein